MNRRGLSIVLLLCCLAPGGLASAATKPKPKPAKPVCNLVKDVALDAFAVRGTPTPQEPSLDAVSADIANNGKTLTAVVRLSALSLPDQFSPLGNGYYLDFNVTGSDTTFFLGARLGTPQGNAFTFGHTIVPPTAAAFPKPWHVDDATVTGTVDTTTKEVRISVPLTALAPHFKLTRGTKLSNLAVLTGRLDHAQETPSATYAAVPGNNTVYWIDEAVGDAKAVYAAGSPSCVRIGQ